MNSDSHSQAKPSHPNSAAQVSDSTLSATKEQRLVFEPIEGLLASLDQLSVAVAGPILHLRLNRPAKRNAISDVLVQQVHTAFLNLPDSTKVVILSGEGSHFCAGLDLGEVGKSGAEHGMWHSRSWHSAFNAIQFGPVPVIAVLHGAVVGGGLEIAAACHLRVAESSAYFGLPEGQRGLFVGGGGSVRIPRMIGVSRMTDMPVTSWKGRVLISAPASATPMMMLRPQPLCVHSSAWRITFVLPMHSKL